MDPAEQSALTAALDRMWAQFLPEMKERVGILETTARSIAAGELSLDQQATANDAAHKLAGVLGTFGLTRGTVLARELEIMYSRETGTDPALAERLASLADELRTLIENRK